MSGTRSSARQPAAYSRCLYGVSKLLLLCWCKLWLRLAIEGRGRVPRTGPVLLVGNHASYLDPPLLGMGTTRQVRFLAQAGLGRLGPLRWWMRQVGVTLIDRNAPSKDVLRQVAAALEQGACVALFPEGTRSRDGTVGPFRAGVEFLVRRTGAVVVPIGIDGARRALPRGAVVPRPFKVVVRVGEPWAPGRVLAPGGLLDLRATVAGLARAGLGAAEPRVDPGPGPVPADPTSSSAGGRA